MERTLFINKFLAVIERDGYSFVHEVRCDGRIVSLLPFRRVGKKLEFLARREICPAHGLQMELCSITGGVDKGKMLLEAARDELYEEAGYTAELTDFISLGQVTPSKILDSIVYLFAVDVTQKKWIIPQGDGSSWETGASVMWLSGKDSLFINDPLFTVAITRLLEILHITSADEVAQ